jgi:ribosome biogenesis GTPase
VVGVFAASFICMTSRQMPGCPAMAVGAFWMTPDMTAISLENLFVLGLSPRMVQALASFDFNQHTTSPPGPGSQWMRIAVVHRETLEVHDGQRTHSARALPRLARDLLDQGSVLAVGDWTLAATDEHGQIWAYARLPPLNQIVRRDADGSRHTVVSNVDTALLVMGLDLDFNLPRLERYLALARAADVLPVVVLTKADTVGMTPEGSLPERVAEVRARIGHNVEVLTADARSPDAATALAPFLAPGQTLVMLGSSGAGKSTLTNTLLGEARQDTGTVREHDSRGKHTTTARSLHLLPSGACVIDTPGVRTLRPDVDAHTVSQLFDDVSALALQCRFRDCRHQDEPGCAVRDSVNPGRLKNFQKLLRESQRDSMSALEKQRLQALWKARGRAGQERWKMKRGDLG